MVVNFKIILKFIIMSFICHRINNSYDLSKVESNYGVEIDLRDDNDFLNYFS